MNNLNEMKAIELKQLAKDNDIPSWWSLKKDELIAALEEVLNSDEVDEAEEAPEAVEVEEDEEPGEYAQMSEEEIQNLIEDASKYGDVSAEEMDKILEEEEKKIPEGYEATVIDNTVVMVSRNEYAEADEEPTPDEFETDSEEPESNDDEADEEISKEFIERLTNVINKSLTTTDEVDEPEAAEADESDEDTEALQAELEEVERQIAELQAHKKEIKAKMKKSKTGSNEKLIEFNGKSQNLTAWAKELGFKNQTLFGRIYEMGWTVEKAFTTPVKSRTKKVEE